MSRVDLEDSHTSTHGKALCWVARISGTVLSLLAAAYSLHHEVDFDSGRHAIPLATWLFVLSVAPSFIAWWSHRIGGAFVLIVCLFYTESAYGLANRAAFLHVVLPFSAVWVASGILHLIVSWLEEKRGRTGHQR